MQDFTRYSCQIALPDFDEQSQKILANAKVLIVGMGGLGCPAAQYLVSSGIGTIGFADFDIISEKNLHRQILYTPQEVGQKKAIVAGQKLLQQNPSITINTHLEKISFDNVTSIINNYDIVVDCSDNFETRYILNDACVLSGKPLVYGAIYQYEGQVSVWNTTNDDGTKSPNYRDLYPDVNAAAIPNCAEGGVIPTIAGIIGLMQANEVIKLITNTGETLKGKLLVFDAQTLRSRILKLGHNTKTNITTLEQNAVVKEVALNILQENIDQYYLIDVRTDKERAMFNIGGQHIPLQDIANVEIDTNKPIVCYCASGIRSKEAVKILAQKYSSAELYSLKGGVSELQGTH